MKRFLLIFIATGFIFSSMAQIKPFMNHPKSGIQSMKPTVQIDGQVVGLKTPNTIVTSDATLADWVIMTTLYDLQTNSSMQQRHYRYSDGTMAGIATFSQDNAYTTRGTGYNYDDGSGWGALPSAGIETNRTGWPAYAPLGANGEIVIAHSSGTEPLFINRRDTRGTGVWRPQTELFGPADAAGLLWCRMVTSGTDHMSVHVFALTSPTGNGGTVWNDMDGALIYNRSLDGGDTWDGWEQLDGMTSQEYLGFGGDAYCWAQPVGNTLAFVAGDSFNDEFIMKSTDNGDTWTKIIVWDCPYDLWESGDDTTGWFFSSDGNSAAAIGPDGKVHVAFGHMRSMGDDAGTYWTTNWDGLVYWNEDMPQLPQTMDWDELYASGNMIGWITDTAVWEIAGTQYPYFYNSMTSIPAIVVDDANQVFAFWSGLTTNEDPNGFLLRHLYARASVDGGTTWRDTIVDLTGETIQQWTEFVFTSVAPQTTDYIYLTVQDDDLGGNYLKSTNAGYQGQMEITTNNITAMEIAKADIILWPVGVNDKKAETFTVTQNYPNPVTDRSMVSVQLTQPGNLSLGVYNVVGQKVVDYQQGFVNAGTHQFVLDGSQLRTGVYFYTVTLNRTSITKKMIVN